MKWNSFNCL